MSRPFYVVGTTLLGFALVLSFLGSISLPYLSNFDYTRVSFGGSTLQSGSRVLRQIRWGIWGPCLYDGNKHEMCFHTGYAYSLPIIAPGGQIAIVDKSFTRGLAVHPVAAGTVAIAFACALSATRTEHGIFYAAAMSLLSAILLIIAFAIDIALFVDVHSQIGTLHDIRPTVNAGTAFWTTLTSFLLVIVAAFSLFIARRQELRSDSYPMLESNSGGCLPGIRRS
ncbi:unnamed protein product [Mycena citricolor]|nr:unnamed protein product [Mycena citricolor]